MIRKIFCFVVLLGLVACEKNTLAPPTGELLVPSEFQVMQRSTVALPGSDGEWLVTIDDVTRGQVKVQLAPHQGPVLVAYRSMRVNDKLVFEINGVDYQLMLKRMNNQLIGDDSVLFVLTKHMPNAGSGMTFDEEIRWLLDDLQKREDVVMIRNGKEYAAETGAGHLRGKYQHVASKITSTEQFIDEVASKSSMSGEAYEMKYPDGRTMTTNDYFRERLMALRAGGE